MYDKRFDREANLIGVDKLELLSRKTVFVFGLGGVGSYAAEALCRGGIGNISIVDGDRYEITNINRQLFATEKTLGKLKTEVAAERLKDINPKINVTTYSLFFSAGNLDKFDFSKADYIVDCIDTVTSKILLVEVAKSLNKPVISCLGTGNKLDPTRFKVMDIYETKVCPLAKVMRSELRKRGIERLKVVSSEEPPLTPKAEDKRTPASISFVPPVAGMIIAGEVIKDLIG